jgi:hypothetical protein
MSQKVLSMVGVLGVGLFAATALLGGLLIENYQWTSQLISETYAIDTEYGWELRMYGFVASGLLIGLFCFLARRHFSASGLATLGMFGIGIFYGLATVVVSFFPCDSGCNKEFIDPSLSQFIHNAVGFLTYALVPVFILLVGQGLKATKDVVYARQSTIIGLLSIVGVGVFFMNANGSFAGLFQRLVEGAFVIWVLITAYWVARTSPQSS